MLFRGGGVGHKSTRAFTQLLEQQNLADSLRILEDIDGVTAVSPDPDAEDVETEELPLNDELELEEYLEQTEEAFLDEKEDEDEDEFS